MKLFLIAILLVITSPRARAEFLLQGRGTFYFQCSATMGKPKPDPFRQIMIINEQPYDVGPPLDTDTAECQKASLDSSILFYALAKGQKVTLNEKTVASMSTAADKIRKDIVKNSADGKYIENLHQAMNDQNNRLKECQAKSSGKSTGPSSVGFTIRKDLVKSSADGEYIFLLHRAYENLVNLLQDCKDHPPTKASDGFAPRANKDGGQ